MKIKHEDRFSWVELFAMFNVELSDENSPPSRKRNARLDDSLAYVDEVENVIIPLWKFKTYTPPKGRGVGKSDVDGPDRIREGITAHPPGSDERVQDLIRFYADHPDESAFKI